MMPAETPRCDYIHAHEDVVKAVSEAMPEDEILSAKNLILSPHIAAQTREASFKMAQMCIEGCFDVLEGKKIRNVANPQAYNHARWKDIKE